MDTPKIDIARSNSAIHDEFFTDKQGRRVYFHEDGRPYVHDSRGRRITRFKGAEEWSPFVDNINTKFRPFSNVVTYEIKGIDSEGNLIKEKVYTTELVDIMDYKTRRMADNVEKDIRDNAFDYVLAKKVLRAHNDFSKEGISVDSLEINTLVDGQQVATHSAKDGYVTPVETLKPQNYTNPTVFNPMKIRRNEWFMPDVLTNESLARQHRQGDGRDYLSLRGVGLQNANEIDTDAVQRLFGGDVSTYRLYESEDYFRLKTNEETLVNFEEGATPEERARIQAKQVETERQQRIQEAVESKRKFIEREMIEQGKDPGAPIVYKAYETITAEKKQEVLDKRNRVNDPAYKAVFDNLREYEEVFVQREKQGYIRSTYLSFNEAKIPDLYNQGEVKAGNMRLDFHINDGMGLTEKEKRELTKQRLADMELNEPDRYQALLEAPSFNDDGERTGYRYALMNEKITDARTDAQKQADMQYEKLRLELDAKMKGKDLDEQYIKRLGVTHDVLEYYGGFESYQKAERAYRLDEIGDAVKSGAVEFESGKGYFVSGEGGRNYLQDTYNFQGEKVWALLPSGSLEQNLDKNIHVFVDEETGKREFYDAVTLDELESGRVRLNNEHEKNLFVLTDIGRQKVDEARKTAVKVRQHNEVINEMLRVVREARDNNQEEQIRVTEKLKETFGIEKDELTSRQMFVHTSKYFNEANAAGMTNVTFNDADIRNGRAFNNMRGYLYQARAERHPVWDELKRWGNVSKEIYTERSGLLREFNVLTDDTYGTASSYATSEELQRKYDERFHLNELHAETTKYNKITDDTTESLARIAEGQTETENTGKRAKREIMDAIIQSRADMDPEEQAKRQAIQAAIASELPGYPITKANFHALRMGRMKEERAMLLEAGLPIEEFTQEIDPRSEQVGQLRTDGTVPVDMQSNERPGTPIRNTTESLSRETSNRIYDSILDDINRNQVAMGLPQLRALDVSSMQSVLSVPKEIQDWKDTQERLATNQALYRRKGDYSLYDIKDVLDDGTVIGEKLALPASAFNLELKVDESWAKQSRDDIRKSLDQTTDAMLPESEKIGAYELTPEQVRSLETARTTHVTKVVGDQKYQNIFSQLSFGELITGRDQMERYNSDGTKFNNQVNKRLMDVTASRAGWMIRKGNEAELMSNIWEAVYMAAEEQGAVKMTTKNGVNVFDEAFEDSFTKYLHRAHFENASMDGPKQDASRSLILDVADFAKEYVKDDPNLSAEVNQKRLEKEVHHLLSTAAVDKIEQYGHYEDALKPSVISETLRGGRQAMSSVSSLDQNHYAADPDSYKNEMEYDSWKVEDDGPNNGQSESFDEQAERQSTQLTDAEILERELDDNRKTIERNIDGDDLGGYISEGKVKHHYYEMDFVRRGVDGMVDGSIKESEENRLRKIMGDDFVDNISRASDNSDWALFRQYYDNRLLPEYGGDGAYQVIQNLNGYTPDKNAKPVMNEGFWQGIHKEILTPNLSTPDRVKSYVELIDSMPSIEANWSLNKDELVNMMPDKSVGGLLKGRHELSDMIPEDDTFHVFVGNQGDLLARSNMTNHVFNITGKNTDGGMERVVDAWSGFVEKPMREGFVSKLPTMDGTHVSAPADALPIAINNGYNTNRINRSPSGVGFMSSSDVSTRAALGSIIDGQQAVGFDFETTGFMNSQFLKDRGIVLPTEAFYRTGQMLDGQFQQGEGKHVFLDVGAQTDKNGVTVRDIVAKELGTMNSSQVVEEVLGSNAKRWDMLSADDQLKVMKSDKVSFLRNIAKYSDSLSESDMANVTNFNYRPTSFKNEYQNLVRHAKSGIDNLAAGTVKSGATYAKSLGEFMDIYNEQTAGKVLVAQNGADADLPWARHFSEVANVPIETKPQMVEMIHLSRLLNPEERSHSLASQIGRSQIPGLLEQYNSGSHLADVDTDSMMRLFGEKYLPESQAANLQQMDWLKPGQYMVRLGSTGSNKLPHDVYQVAPMTKQDMRDPETGTHRLQLQNMSGEAAATIETPSLQELQRNVSKNYKVFDSRENAEKFLQDLTFDDAREDVSGATLSYDNMIRERNRRQGIVQGDGTDVGMQNLSQRYNELQEGIQKHQLIERFNSLGDGAEKEKLRSTYDFLATGDRTGAVNPDELSPIDQKIIQNGGTVSAQKMAKYGTPEYSERQRRAMAETSSFFDSEDAKMRQEFLGEVENLKAAGAVDETSARSMISEYNNRIKQRARDIGRGPLEREVPGLVDLGRVEGEQFTGLQGRRLTTLANTYEQAERGLWEAANEFKPLTSYASQQEGTWRGEAVNMLTQHLKQTGIMAPDAGNRMEDAVDAVLTQLETQGNMKVEDITQPLVRDWNDNEMRQIFLDTRNEILAEPMELVNSRPDMKSTYDATKQMRSEVELQGLATHGFNYKVAGDYQGQNIKTTGDFAFRHADDLMDEIQTLRAMDNQESVTPRVNDLWREIYSRATDGVWNESLGEMQPYSDREAAISYMGWDSTPNQYVHPSETQNYPAGTKYYDMEEADIRRIAGDGKFTGSPRPEIRDHAREYLNHAFGENGIERTFTHVNPSQRMNMESLIEVITAEPETPAPVFDRYVDEVEWDRPLNSNRPMSEVDHVVSSVREKVSDVRNDMAQYMPSKKVMGIIAAGAGAAYLVSQWTRGDGVTPESRPQSDQAPDVNGNYQQRGQGIPESAQPQMNNGAYVQPNEGVNINIQAKNRNNVTQGQIDSAIQQAMGGQSASVTVHHQDDTTSINSQWLQDKFAQLLDNGFVN